MTKRSKKVFRIILTSLGVLLLILCGVIWYIANNLEKVVRTTLIEEVNQHTDGLYTLQLGELDISVARGTVRINNIDVLIDSSRLYQLEVQGKKPRYTFNINVKSIKVDIDKLLKIRKGSSLDVDHIIIQEPLIMLTETNAAKKETEKSAHTPLPFFGSLIVEDIKILNGKIDYYIQGNKDTSKFKAETFSLQINNTKIDSLINLINPLVHVEDGTLEVNKVQHFILNNALLFSIEKLSAELKNASVKIDSLAITPQYEKEEFAHKTPNHNDIIKLSIKNINLLGIHFNELFDNRALIIDTMAIDSLLFWSYKNKKLPPIAPKEKLLFHRAIQQIPIPIAISTITVSNSEADYEELSLNGKSPGKITFTNLNAEINGLTNIVREPHELYTLKGSANVFGKGALEATIKFPVSPDNDYFEASGHLGKMDLTIANQMITPLAFVEIKSGTIQRMDFTTSGNSRTAKTNMIFLYDNLKIAILNQNKENHKTRKFLSRIANSLLISSSNPPRNGKIREVKAAISERDPYLSNFNYWWRGIREGMMSSFGLPGK